MGNRSDGAVHYSGTVCSVGGFALGSDGNESVVISSSSNLNVSSATATSASFTTIHGVTSLTTTTTTITTATITTGNITTLTAGTVQLAALTTNTVKIGTVPTGWNNTGSTITYNNLTSSTLNFSLGSVINVTVGAALYHSVTFAATGGYSGEQCKLVITAGGTGGVVSFVNTSVTTLSTGTITVTGTSTYIIEFLRGSDRFYEIARTGALS